MLPVTTNSLGESSEAKTRVGRAHITLKNISDLERNLAGAELTTGMIDRTHSRSSWLQLHSGGGGGVPRDYGIYYK